MRQKIYSRLSTQFKSWLSPGRIYIIPTRIGFYFLVFLGLIFLLSLVFGHSLGFSLVFILFGLTAVTAIITNENLKDLHLESQLREFIYEDGSDLSLEVRNKGAKTRFCSLFLNDYFLKTKTYPVHQSCHFKLKLKDKKKLKRGVYSFSAASLETLYPYGLFKAWKPQIIKMRVFIPPALKEIEDKDYGCVENYELDKEKDGAKYKNASLKNSEREDFVSHKKIVSDSHLYLKDIDWFVYARKREYFKREYEGSNDIKVLMINVGNLPYDQETSLSVAFSICENFKNENLLYGVSVGGVTIPPSQGGTHHREIVKLLSSCGRSDE